MMANSFFGSFCRGSRGGGRVVVSSGLLPMMVLGLAMLTFVGSVTAPSATAQSNKADSREAAQRSQRSQQIRGKKPSRQQKLITVRGQIDQSGNAGKFKINFKEIETTLNQQVDLPRAPFPRDWEKASQESKIKWMTQFQQSDAGKKFIARNQQILEDAPAFNLRYNPDGEFIVYDVPPGIYGLQGRVDKEIDGVLHAFEVFAQITIDPAVDEVKLDPLPVLVTPLLKSGTDAPPVNIVTHDGKAKLTLNSKKLKGKYVFLNFWSTEDYQDQKTGTDHQKNVQKMVADLKDKYDLSLLNICMDDNRRAAVKHIMKNQYKLGLHGFTNGREHETVDRYGVRSTPSGFLIAPDRTIAMSQYEFYNLTQQKDSLTTVIEDRITGKDKPTPAKDDEAEDEAEE